MFCGRFGGVQAALSPAIISVMPSHAYVALDYPGIAFAAPNRPRSSCFRVFVVHILKTPNRGSGIGALYAADNPSASDARVSTGSRTPSSHSRAVE